MAAATAVDAMLAAARSGGWPLDAERVRCPVRFVWGTADLLLPWPAAAAGLRASFWHADWVVLDDVGHAPQLDVPEQVSALILDWAAAAPRASAPSLHRSRRSR